MKSKTIIDIYNMTDCEICVGLFELDYSYESFEQ